MFLLETKPQTGHLVDRQCRDKGGATETCVAAGRVVAGQFCRAPPQLRGPLCRPGTLPQRLTSPPQRPQLNISTGHSLVCPFCFS